MAKRVITNEELTNFLLKPLKDRQTSQTNITENNDIAAGLNISIMDYINNPTGKGTAYVANRASIKQGLRLDFIKLLRSYRRNFYAVPYIYDNGDILYYVKVPSEFYKDNKIAYDVLFLLKNDPDRKWAKRDIRIYSNCPSFIYTYCYVYNKKGLLIDKLKNKFPIEALTKPPVVRNPIESLGFEKSTFIAACYLFEGGCLTDEYINRYGKKINPLTETSVFSKIANPELITAIYQHAKYKSRKTHRKELDKETVSERDSQARQYSQNEKKNRPNGTTILSRAPRSKITARKATRSLFISDSNKSRKIKSKDKI